MAFDAKSAAKARAVVLIAVLVVVAVIAAVLVFGQGQQQAPVASDGAGQATAGTTDAATSDGDAMAEIDAQYGTAAQALLGQYNDDPSNPSTLLNLANGYFDWGVAATSHAADSEDEAHAVELLNQAISYYDTYLEEHADSKSVIVDRAICVFYTGDHETAISQLEDLVTNQDASFAPAWANLGMFYEADGRTDDARQAYETAIDTAGDTDSYNVRAYAEERLSALDDAN